ncbi:MAG: thiamine diphosphokinase [Clostridia bacterium]|nr:thiamine diphosphokinase [Clostridia bacterium]
MKGVCHVVGAGRIDPALLPEKKESDLILAADGGLEYLSRAGKTADLFIGDGDSLGYLPTSLPVLSLPCEKDDTDMIAACRHGLFLGYRRFRLYGALGGKRFSHSLANLQTLFFLKSHGAEGEIVDPYCRVLLLEAGTLTLAASDGYFSLFAAGGEAEVSVSGAKYNVNRARVTPDFPLGVSNEARENTRITVHSGCLIVVVE